MIKCFEAGMVHDMELFCHFSTLNDESKDGA
jgi:hypothetical protein